MSKIAGECTICGNDLMHNEEVYAITAGVMRLDMDGVCPGDDTPWEDVICMECIDEVDQALLNIRERQRRLQERRST